MNEFKSEFYPIPIKEIADKHRCFYPYMTSIDKTYLLDSPSKTSTYLSNWKYRFFGLLDILDELSYLSAKNDIPILTVKGFAYALTVYPDFFSRPFSDIDIFVLHKDYAKAIKMLLKSGFSETSKPHYSKNHRAFSKKSVTVELHHDFSRDFDFKINSDDFFFENPVLVEFDSIRFLVPKAEKHIIYSVIHAFNHGFFNPPIWVLDIYLTAFKNNISLEELQKNINPTSLKRITNIAFAIVDTILDLNLKLKISPLEKLISEFVVKKLKTSEFPYFSEYPVRFLTLNTMFDFSFEENLNFLTSRW